MNRSTSIYQDIAARTGGSIYIGVVGPVRTGKSTFIKRFMETQVLPHIDNTYRRDRAQDELPQSGSGRTIMTAEPKFVPEEAVRIHLEDDVTFAVRLIDCVGYMIPGATGQMEGESPRMVSTPWLDHEVTMSEAAELGTTRVIREHSTIGVVVTTDGSITDIPREDYREAEARAIEKGLEGAEYTVGELKKGKRAKQPTPAFITSTLQQEASRRLGFTATRTMRAAQTLYEGVDIAGHGTMGLITYMRTDSLRISDEAVAAAKEYIAGAYGENYICPYKRAWKTKSATAAQDAHEAIRPSVPSLTPDEVDQSISGDTAKLYRMIWSRFMASQMADCQQDTVSVTVYAGDYRFKASGYTVTFDGFTVLYEEATDEKEKKETSLPPLEQGQVLKLKELKSEQKFTQPPARYTEATLIKALEENGIGRPSTYAPIITTIIDRGYVERDQKKLKPTLLGRAVDGLMLEQFPHIVDVDFSAEMEKNLDKVESGKADWHKTVDDFYQGFAASLEQAEKNMEGKKVKVPDEPSSEVCDLCGRPMVIKVGKYGKFLACSGFPECRGTKRLVKDTGGICPKCGKGRLLERKSSKGRIYYGCERYPDCDFMTWDMPVATKCEKCGSTLFRKGSKLYCAKEGCDFEMPVPKKD